MLNPFPALFTYVLVAPLILRLVLGVFIISRDYSIFKNTRDITTKILSGFFVFAGLLIFFGIYTQVGALLLIALSVGRVVYIKSRLQTITTHQMMLHIFTIAISCSLLFSGAGWFAIDITRL